METIENMNLKKELELLRGEPIIENSGDPLEIPCIETSDASKLCKNPVVSVHMITYNHEPYIRQAIEGVMMQKTDFEFELVIGEDASTDKTREICFEYQKKYPDKIRVLWWHENLRKVRHSAGGNAIRNRVHCRGEFIAFCEGDDYWIDSLKLQKQVDVMRKYPNIGLCFCNGLKFVQKKNIFIEPEEKHIFQKGVISGQDFLKHNIFVDPTERTFECFLLTCSAMYRKKVFMKVYSELNILSWRLKLGDVPLWLSLATTSDVYYIDDKVSVYRITVTGAVATEGASVWRDNYLTRVYFSSLYFSGVKDSLCVALASLFSMEISKCFKSRKMSCSLTHYYLGMFFAKFQNKQLRIVKKHVLKCLGPYYFSNTLVCLKQNLRNHTPDFLRKFYRFFMHHGEFKNS